MAAALTWCQCAAQVRGAGSKSGTLEKALLEAHAARTLAEGDYQDARFSLPPGFLGGATGPRSPHLSGPLLFSPCKTLIPRDGTLAEGAIRMEGSACHPASWVVRQFLFLLSIPGLSSWKITMLVMFSRPMNTSW